MTTLFLIVSWGLALFVTRWFALLTVVTIAACWPRRPSTPSDVQPATLPRFLFVIPAHDESSVVGITVHSCRAVAYDPERFQVCVIADNCTDDTATVAEIAGATVVVRSDLARKSKGFALEDFFRGVAANRAIQPHDAFVLVDADTSVDPGLLQAFARSLAQGADFVQGYYTVRNADASWRTRLMTYAFSLANGVWLVGFDRLGWSVGLKGNGMCFRAAALDRFPWQAHGLVEDMEYAWNLRLGGERVRFQPLARVYGEMVSRGGAGAASQRRRWESGRRTLRSSFRERLRNERHLSPLRRLAYQVELTFPPLGRLGVSLGIVSALAGVGLIISQAAVGWVLLATLLGIEWIIFTVYLITPVFVINLPIRFLLGLIHAPYYLVWKGMLGVLRTPQQWIRTPRETIPSDTRRG